MMANNEENLKNGVPYQFGSGAEAVENGRKGGIASGKARKEKKIIRDAILKRLKASDLEEIADGMIQRAKKRRMDAETLRDTIDGKPKETTEAEITVEADVGLSLDDKRKIIAEMLADD